MAPSSLRDESTQFSDYFQLCLETGSATTGPQLIVLLFFHSILVQGKCLFIPFSSLSGDSSCNYVYKLRLVGSYARYSVS